MDVASFDRPLSDHPTVEQSNAQDEGTAPEHRSERRGRDHGASTDEAELPVTEAQEAEGRQLSSIGGLGEPDRSGDQRDQRPGEQSTSSEQPRPRARRRCRGMRSIGPKRHLRRVP